MTHLDTPIIPKLDPMTAEEKWDRLHDFFTMDHAISYKTHKRMGTVQAWVDDTVEAYGKMMHGAGEYEVSDAVDGMITVRFKNCLRLKKQCEIARKCELGFEGREICEVEKLHLTHPNHPTNKMGINPVEITWEDGGCVWTFKTA